MMPLPEFFASKTERSPSGCLLWTGAASDKGYGIVSRPPIGRRQATAVAWYLEHGVWPTAWMLHTCDTPPCVEVAHLYEGDQYDNMADAHGRGRMRQSRPGEQNGRSKLTTAQVTEIRARYTGAWGQQTALAQEYGVSTNALSRIVRKVTHAPV